MRIRDLVTCHVCGRVVAMQGRKIAEHAKQRFAWNTCAGSGQAPA